MDAAGIDPGRSVKSRLEAEAEVDVTLTPFSAGGGIDVVGTVSAPWVGLCRRCATPVSGQLSVGVRERFVDPPMAEDEFYPIVDDTIDLGPLVRDAIVLELPTAPLCREDCAGLCPQLRGPGPQRGVPVAALPRPTPHWANLDVLPVAAAPCGRRAP